MSSSDSPYSSLSETGYSSASTNMSARVSDSSALQTTEASTVASHAPNLDESHYRKTYVPALIARRPCTMLCGTMFVTIFLSVVGFFAATTKIDAGGTFYPPNERESEEWDAFLQRRADDETLPVVAERTQVGYSLFFYYEANGGNQDVFTDDRLRTMKKVEDSVINDPDFSKFCLLESDGAGGTKCKPWLSVVNRFFNADGTIVANKQAVLSAIAADSFERDFFLQQNYATTGSSSVTKSLLQFGLPYSGYRNADEDIKGQKEKFTDFIKDFVEPFAKASTGDLGVYYVGDVITDLEINRLIFRDLAIIGASVLLVFILIWIQTWSVFLALCAMVHILMSAPLAFFFYRMLFQLKVFPAFNFIAIFIVLGIGADDVFVFTDAWKQSRHDPRLVADNEVRLSWVWRRAGKSMLITSFTTFAAFVATSTSTVPAIRTFGIYAAITVFMNFFLCISWYAGCVMFWHHHLEYKCWGCSSIADKPPVTSVELGIVLESGPIKGGKASKNGSSSSGSSSSSSRSSSRSAQDDGGSDLEAGSTSAPKVTVVRPVDHEQGLAEKVENYRPLEKFYYQRFAPFIERMKWPLIVVCACIVIAGIGGCTQLRRPNEREIGLPSGHPLLAVLRINDDKFKATKEDIETPIFMVWGIKGIDRSGRDPNDQDNLGRTIFDDNFRLETVADQQRMVEICQRVAAAPFVLQDPSLGTGLSECFMDIFRAWRVAQGKPADVTAPETLGAELLKFQNDDASEKVRKLFGFRSDGSVKFAALKFTSSLPSNPSNDIAEQHRDWWFATMKTINAEPLSPSTLQGYCAAELFVWLRATEVYAGLAVTGLAIASVLAYIVLISASWNIIVATLAFVVLASIATTVVGFMVLLGWKLDFNEAIAMTVLAGLSVDYVVHVAVAYIHGDPTADDTRFNRMRQSITEMGISICGGAATTMAATVLMVTASTFPFFSRFGSFIFITIAFSFLYSNFLFTSLTAAIGPTGTQGDLAYYAKQLWQRWRG